MRRADREITDKEYIYKIIDDCICCRLGFYDEGEVYIVPLNFGYETLDDSLVLYFHSAKEGRKIDLMKKTNTVGFEMDTDYQLSEGKSACFYTAKFKSIIGTGKISIVEDKEEKEKALQSIMYHNTKKTSFVFNEKMVDLVCIFKVVVDKLSCKNHE